MAVLDLAASPDPLSARIVAVNQPMERILVGQSGTALGRVARDFTLPERQEEAAKYLGLLTSSLLDGYHLNARIRQSSGEVVDVQVWVRRLELGDGHNLAATIVAPGDVLATDMNTTTVSNSTVDVAVIITDSGWAIEEASDAVRALLGYEPAALVGRSLLTLVHAQDTPPFLLGLAQTIASHQTVVARARVAGSDGTWREMTCLLSAVNPESPLRLGIVLTSGAPQLDRVAQGSVLGPDLMRILEDITASGPINSANEHVRKLIGLSERQREIVARLLAGERAPQIAKAMFLSPSTVRNHLTAVFRKFGVHSQVELIALLRHSVDPPQRA
jgi:PAS domain S-box-containing protein